MSEQTCRLKVNARDLTLEYDGPSDGHFKDVQKLFQHKLEMELSDLKAEIASLEAKIKHREERLKKYDKKLESNP